MIRPGTAKARFFLGFVIVTVACLLVGATRVASSRRSRDVAAQRTRDYALSWHAQIASELPADRRTAWLQAASHDPIGLLQACATEAAEQR